MNIKQADDDQFNIPDIGCGKKKYLAQLVSVIRIGTM